VNQIQGNRAAASQAYADTIVHSRKSGNIMTEIAATTCLGQIQEMENQAYQAAETFQAILQLMGDPPWPAACEACVGLARLHYQWNELETAERYAQQGLALARQLHNVDTPAACGVLLARVKLAQGGAAEALTTLAETDQFVQQHHFGHWAGEITAVRIQALLQQGNLVAAAQLAQAHDLPISQARVHLAQHAPAAALAVLEPVRQQAETRGWADKRLQAMLLQALAHQAAGANEKAVQQLDEALTLAAPGGLLRVFIDEGPLLAALLREAAAQGVAPTYVQPLLTACGETLVAQPQSAQSLPDPLSDRELEVLRLLKTELTGPEIARELMISLNTMRTHTKSIYAKLGANSRRSALRRAEELDLL
jgi:LuxR family maltose regulon positive regulatory protein